MKFEAELKRYAELLVNHGLNVQEGQLVNINSEIIHRRLVGLITEAAYQKGAKLVMVNFIDPQLTRTRLLTSKEAGLEYVPEFVGVKYREFVDQQAANLKIIGSEFPEILSDLDPQKVNKMRLSERLAVKYFYDEGIGKSKVHWTVAAAATEAWGKQIFPELSPSEGRDSLWREILAICRADKEDCLSLWKEHNEILWRRAQRLSELKIKILHFTGPGTDLKVGLHPRAIFKGGQDRGPRGVDFEPNIPTEEVFTTPNFHLTSGKVRTTRPFVINGKLIKDLELEFTNGEISSFKASDGEETFKEYINSDAGGKRLGEVALVGIDSPVYKSGLVFREILFDENAACHIAIGSAYKFCIDGGDNLKEEEAKEIGCNESSVHTDMMISSEEVDVKAITYSNEELLLIKNGAWLDNW